MLISHSQLENHYVSWENSVDMFAIFTRYSDIESHIHTVTTTWKFQDPGCMTWSDDQAMIPIWGSSNFWSFFVFMTLWIWLFSWLVVYLPLWKIWKSVGMILPNIWKNKKCLTPPTRHSILIQRIALIPKIVLRCSSPTPGSLHHLFAGSLINGARSEWSSL